MDEKIFDEWNKKINIEVGKLRDDFKTNYEMLKKALPKDSEEMLEKKALNKLRADYKRKLYSNATHWEGFVLSYGQKRDMNINIRKQLLDRYNEALKTNSMEEMIKEKVIRLEEKDGKKIPIFLQPKLKTDGTPSKIAGRDLTSEEDSYMQNVYGVCLPQIEVKEGMEKPKPKPFSLSLQGKTCKDNIPLLTPISFVGIDKSQQGENMYNISSNDTDFIPAQNESLKKALEGDSIQLIEKMFNNFTTRQSKFIEWINNNKIPPNFTNLTVVKEANLISYSEARGSKTLIIDDEESPVEERTTTVCKVKEDVNIDFAEGSKVLVVGRPWLAPPGGSNPTPNVIMLDCMVLPYKDWIIPKVEVKQLGDVGIKPEVKNVYDGVKLEGKSNEVVAKDNDDFFKDFMG
tara:strand:- start:29161 stop:30369 length:1209 start_codon:yes stop_codon:yes gene_type:complete